MRFVGRSTEARTASIAGLVTDRWTSGVTWRMRKRTDPAAATPRGPDGHVGASRRAASRGRGIGVPRPYAVEPLRPKRNSGGVGTWTVYKPHEARTYHDFLEA